MNKAATFLLLGCLCLFPVDRALADVIWVDWQVYSPAGATVTGTIGSIQVSATGVFNPAPQLGLLPGESNWWACCVVAYSAPNLPGPPTSDMIRLTGGPGTGTYTLTFSKPVTNPVMAIASLGGTVLPRTSMVFDTAFVIRTTGQAGSWGLGTPFSQTGMTLDGLESNGLIQFQGTVSQITWTLPTAENWFGFTVGLPVLKFGTVVLGWDLTVATADSPIDANRVYRGFDQVCDNPNPLPEQVASTTYPAITYTDATIPLTLNRVCYEVTAVNVVGESLHSNRALATIGSIKPGTPLHLRIISSTP